MLWTCVEKTVLMERVNASEKTFAQVWQYIQTVSVHQKPLTRFRVISEALPANEQIPGGTESKKYGETRYG
jgi:hypothetical protein